MEEAVWIAIGIVSVILGVGVIATIISHTASQNAVQQLTNAVQALGVHCEQVCPMTEGTALGVTVELPADTVLFGNNDLICGRIGDDAATLSCARCACTEAPGIILNLSGARPFFRSYEYTCRATRIGGLAPGIQYECTG
jgi:hypothetical protein